METVDLPCSCNARSQTPLVGHVQWEINQPPSLRALSGTRTLRRMRRERPGALLARRTRTMKGRGWSPMISCARATRGLRRPSLDVRSRSSISPHPWEKTSKLGVINRWAVLGRCAQSRATSTTPLTRGEEDWKAFVRDNGTSRRASGWAGEKVSHSEGRFAHPLWRR